MSPKASIASAALNAKDEKYKILNTNLSFPSTLRACAVTTAIIRVEQKRPKSRKDFFTRAINAAESGAVAKKGVTSANKKDHTTGPKKMPLSIAHASTGNTFV